jgi:hypothetical protein
MASAELGRRVEKVVGDPPAVGDERLPATRFPRVTAHADSFEDLPGTWQAAILEAERNRPKLRVVADA